jgi:signal transduction histidine kinase
LVNLLENAREAVAGAAVPRVVLRAAQVGDRVVLSVLDNGPGIDPAVRPHLFQPYATGKPGGTGLGLALVHRIVTEHGGKVIAEEGLATANGAGACFRIELPLAT